MIVLFDFETVVFVVFHFIVCTMRKMAFMLSSPALLEEKEACMQRLNVFDPSRKRFHCIELVLKEEKPVSMFSIMIMGLVCIY